MAFINDLKDRGLIHNIIPGTEDLLAKEMVSGYIGFDPTADSLHVGGLLQLLMLRRFQQAGHKPYALVGGATGMIGDPSGKSAERNLLDMDEIDRNCAGIRKQMEKFLDFDPSLPNAAVIVNNYDWLKHYSFLEFIRDVGKHITVGYMMAKDSVQKRLETGLSFTEFSYQLIQGFDFYHLYEHNGVKLQMGGADQWGNMVTGTELVRKKGGGEAFAFTSPLITKADGSKFGKSESGNIWLDAGRTSPYQFYQFWMKLTDEDAEKLVLTFSFKPIDQINDLISQHKEAPHKRILQQALAEEMTILVHSEQDLNFAKNASSILFGQATVETLHQLSEAELLEVMEGVPQISVNKDQLNGNFDLLGFFAENKVFSSKGEARKLLQQGGVSINKSKIDLEFKLEEGHLLNGKYILIQKGKSNYTLAIFND